MKSPILVTTLVFVLFYISVRQCHAQSGELIEQRNPGLARRIGNLIANFWTWIKNLARNKDTFVGRCAGAVKRLGTVLQFIVFKLGVIGTILVFLTIFSMKTLGILGILFAINVGGWLLKLSHSKHEGYYHKPQTVHFHVHNKDFEYSGGHHSPVYSYSPYHRISDRNYEEQAKPLSSLERQEIDNLYKRLGIIRDNYYDNYISSVK